METSEEDRPRAKITGHRDLEVWQRAMVLVEQIYRVTKRFPKEETFLLSAQMRRAAISVPSNIAEGHGRTGRSEYLHHLSIAHGSLMELETQIQVAQRLDYLHELEAEDLLRQLETLSRMMRALIRRLRTV